MAPSRSLSRRWSLLPVAALALLGSLGLAPAAMADVLIPETGAGSPNEQEIRELYLIVSGLALVVFTGVLGCLFYCLVKFRAKRGAVAAQVHGNTRLEVAWTVAASLILVFLTIVTFIKLPQITTPAQSIIDRNGNPVADTAQFAATDSANPPRGDSMTIRVDGQQYVWRYQYPGQEGVFSYVDMVVPVGTTVILEITADDVVHNWWIPALGPKFDAIPGYVNRTWFRADEAGTYFGQCAELCGRNHANMIARVIARPFPEYRRWYEGKAREIAEERQLAAEQRQRIAEEGEAAIGAGETGAEGAATEGS